MGIPTTTAAATIDASPWMTIAEAAAYARCHKNTIYREVASGRLKAIRLRSRAFRFHRDWLDAWMASGVVVNPDAPGRDYRIR